MRIVRPEDRICERIQFEKRSPAILSFVGAGGKTTLIYRLSEELKEQGREVIVTTTTRMFRPKENYVEWVGTGSVETLRESLEKEKVVTVGRSLSGSAEKIMGIPEEDYEILTGLADVLLVEADGSRRKPVKVPAEHEPVLFPGTTLVVGVLGMRSIGRSIEEAAHRPEAVAAFLNMGVEHLLTSEDLEKIANSPLGLKKKVNCEFVAVGNQYE